jgi:predicted RNase H-like nuclease (RuvC/YqgF family)
MGDRDYLIAQRADMQEQLYCARQESYSIEEKLRRLRACKGEIAQGKSTFKQFDRKASSLDVTPKSLWEGEKANLFDTLYEEKTDSSFSHYNDQVDYTLDQLYDEITRLENELMNNESLISSLQMGINSLLNELEKLFN